MPNVSEMTDFVAMGREKVNHVPYLYTSNLCFRWPPHESTTACTYIRCVHEKTPPRHA